MTGFEYPTQAHTRRHGPEGYTDYESYRDWLRDEFIFRCVYCLHREQWNIRGTAFHIDHFVPVVLDANKRCEYANLLYACAACNEAKSAIPGIPNPCEVSFGECLRILSNGHVEALNDHGEKLLQVFQLDSAKNVRDRLRMTRILQSLQSHDPELYVELMRFPVDLPDLERKRAPRNTKPDGVTNCYFSLRKRGLLPSTY